MKGPHRPALDHVGKARPFILLFMIATPTARPARAVWLAAVLGAFVAAPADALDPQRDVTQYLVDFWQEEAGLPQNFVYTILQTRDGYLWIGTRGGLARFDGVRLTTYDDSRPGQLREGEVWGLTEGPDGSLWIATFGGGLSRLLRGGEIVTYTKKDGLPSDAVSTVAATSDGTIWIGTDKGLATFRDGHIAAFAETSALPSSWVTRLHADTHGALWIGTTQGLASLRDGKLTTYPALAGKNVRGIAGRSADEGIWLATWGGGAFRLQGEVATSLGTADEGAPLWTTDVCIESHGAVWFTGNEGLLRYRDGRFERYLAEALHLGAQQSAKVVSMLRLQSIFADREGSLWVGTRIDGLARLRDSLFTNVTARPGARDEGVSSLFEDSRGTLWLGSGQHLGRMPATGSASFERFPSELGFGAFAEDEKGTIWAGHETGLYRVADGRASSANLPGVRDVVALLVDGRGRLWIGTRYLGLFRLEGGRLTASTAAEGRPARQIRALAQDRRGGVYVGTKDAGLFYVHDAGITAYGLEQGLPTITVSAAYVDPDDTAWIATRRGLVRVRDGQLATLTTQHGLAANYLYQIVGDGAGDLWFTYARGVMRASRRALDDVADGTARSLDVATFGTESGIHSTAMIVPHQPTAVKRRDGTLWFATQRGITVVDPQGMKRNDVVPAVHVTDVLVDAQSYPVAGEVHVPPGQGLMEVRFTGLSFVDPRRVRFKYRLSGIDVGWVEVRDRRAAYYTHLPPGSYRFEVQACNNDGVWNEAGAAVTIHLQPHWWQTRGFRAGSSAALVLGVLGFVVQRARENKRRERELRQRVEEALAQVKTLRGLLPVCASCRKVRDDGGYWSQMETYIQTHSEAALSHSICPECMARLYPDAYQAMQPES